MGEWKKTSNRSNDLLLVVHVLSDGRLLPSVKLRTWRGAEAWNRRLTPPWALEAPPAPPLGADPVLWALHYVAQELLILQMMKDGAPPEGRPAPPDGGHGGDRLPDGQEPLWPIPSDLVSTPPPGEEPRREASSPLEP